MWFKLDDKRTSKGQRYVVRCAPEIGGATLDEKRPAVGKEAARKAAEMLATSLNASATVYGQDAEGEFVFGVFEVEDSAANSASPLIKRLYAESVVSSLSVKDQLLADIPVEAIKGFAEMSAALGYVVAQHKQIKRAAAPQISYKVLFRIFCGPDEANVLTLPSDQTTIALLTNRLVAMPGWMWLSDLKGAGSADRQIIIPSYTPPKVTLSVDGELQVLRHRTVFRGVVPGTDSQFMVVVHLSQFGYGAKPDGIALIYREADETAVVTLMRTLLREANPFKNRIVLINRDLQTVRSRMSDRSWSSIVPHARAREELDLIAASIRDREMLKTQGLSMRRGLLLSGPPGDGKSTAIECFVNDIAGQATVIIVEAVDHIRAVYALAQTLAPAVVILEDLDLMTKSRQNVYAAVQKDDVTGELLQVLSGGSAYEEVATIATTNHPEAIDEALARAVSRPVRGDRRAHAAAAASRADPGPWEAASRAGPYRGVRKAGIKRARLARRTPEFADFEPGIEAIKSIAIAKPAA